MATPALAAKERGNAAYKAKKFTEAIAAYDEAIALDPNDITFYNNKGAVHFEKKEYDQVIAVCTKGLDVGREQRVDYKHVAKSLSRIGKAHFKKGDLDSAMTFYDKAICEHRDPAVLKERSEVVKLIKEREDLAFIDPVKSTEEKNKGNEVFKQGKYADAIPFYTNAIKRNPQDHVPYSNRAACYTKLMEFGLAMEDCNKCIELNPTFIKGYLRKAALLKIDKPTEAKSVYEKALELDSNNMEAQQGYQHCVNQMRNLSPEERAKSAMKDPEIQRILQDPAMQIILEQMQKDPTAAQEHLKNPQVAEKFQKLVQSGIVSIR